jgi:hypothetical protein
MYPKGSLFKYLSSRKQTDKYQIQLYNRCMNNNNINTNNTNNNECVRRIDVNHTNIKMHCMKFNDRQSIRFITNTNTHYGNSIYFIATSVLSHIVSKGNIARLIKTFTKNKEFIYVYRGHIQMYALTLRGIKRLLNTRYFKNNKLPFTEWIKEIFITKW